MDRVASTHHREAARHIRQLLAAYEDARDLVAIGAYSRGSDPLVDRALELLPAINDFLRQRDDDVTPFDAAIEALVAIDPAFAPASLPGDAPAAHFEPVEVTDATVVEAA
jgi:flagellum-specific ATP synthase